MRERVWAVGLPGCGWPPLSVSSMASRAARLADADLELVAFGDPGRAPELSDGGPAEHGIVIDVASDDGAQAMGPGAIVEILSGVAGAQVPRLTFLPHSYDGLELLGRLCHRFGGFPITEVTALREGEGGVVVSRPICQGRLTAELVAEAGARFVLTVGQTGEIVRSTDDSPISTTAVAAAIDGGALRDRQLLDILEPEGESGIERASRLVAVGRGIGGPEHLDPIERLADLLDARIAASRAVVDAGWLPRQRQVGTSGQTVTPDLYLALGISGASQHLAGMSGARCIVAVNKDPEAPIFRVAHYGIVEDLHQVVPALIDVLEGLRDSA